MGGGAAVSDGWLLAIAYTGWVYDPATTDHKGREFASATAESPFSFRLGVGQVIAGVDRGVAGMRVGGRRRIVAPPELGFGSRATTLVPANATLLLEVETAGGRRSPVLLGGPSPRRRRGGDRRKLPGGGLPGWLYELTGDENKGSLFDSTGAEAPFSFRLGAGEVIAGWDLGVAGMRAGGLRRLVIPHDMAYGAAGAGTAIPPYATLLFEVELLLVE